MPRSPHHLSRKQPPPLDQATLEAAAVSYLERFQTSRARLVQVMARKLRQRGWDEASPPPDLDTLADRMEQLGYVDDAVFAEARARGLARRGMGAMRVKAALAAHGIAATAELLETQDAVAVAIAFARRRRFGPFGPATAGNPTLCRRQFAAMVRAGHPPDLARRIVEAESESDLPEPDE